MDYSSLPTLPSDLIVYEILTRSSPETVAKSRTVCKRWNEDTQSLSFAAEFHRRTNSVSGFFIQTTRSGLNHSSRFVSAFSPNEDVLSLSFLPAKPRSVQIAAAARQGGLLLCVVTSAARRVPEFIVCKPTTRQWRKIPRPKTRFFVKKTAMVVVDSNPRDLWYKIARFSEPTKRPKYRYTKSSPDYPALLCEIFDSRDWAWRPSPEPVRLGLSEFLDPHHPMVSVSGSAYVLTTERRVFALDWAAETWQVIDSPAAEEFSGRLVDCGGKLGLVSLSGSGSGREYMELWVLECNNNNNNNSNNNKHGEKVVSRVWSVRKRVNLEEVLRGASFPTPLGMVGRDVAMFRDVYDMIFFVRFGSECESSSKDEVVKVIKNNNVVSRFRHQVGIFKFESDGEFVDMKSLKKRDPVKTISSSSPSQFACSLEGV